MISFKNFITRFVKKIISYSGYELRGIKPIVAHNNYDSIPPFLVSKILKCEEPIIFDVGANDGQSIERFKKFFQNLKYIHLNQMIMHFKD